MNDSAAIPFQDSQQPSISPLSSEFKRTLDEMLELIDEVCPMDLWLVTRKTGNDWIMLASRDKSYGVEPGDVIDWRTSFCCQMVKGLGPMIAPCSDEVEAYRNAPIGQTIPIKSYIGLPINLDSGEFFGTLCAVHPTEHPKDRIHHFCYINHYAKMLGRMITLEIKLHESRGRINDAVNQSLIDGLTGLGNRAGWENACAIESEISKHVGEYLTVVMIDLDGLKKVNDELGHQAGDELIIGAAETIRSSIRSRDYVARIGGDEFGVLLCGANTQVSQNIAEHIERSLDLAGLSASVGHAQYDFKGDLAATIGKADENMYARKKLRKSARIEGATTLHLLVP